MQVSLPLKLQYNQKPLKIILNGFGRRRWESNHYKNGFKFTKHQVRLERFLRKIIWNRAENLENHPKFT